MAREVWAKNTNVAFENSPLNLINAFLTRDAATEEKGNGSLAET